MPESMVYCWRCWLNQAMRVANFLVNLLGVGMIIYSLCLLKIWRGGIAEVSSEPSPPPRPWFIYTFLGVGIIVSFSAVIGQAVSSQINTTALSSYIVFIISILFLQVGAIVMILFRIDWESVISKYLDGMAIKFLATLSFHLHLCRLVGVIIILAQVNVLVLATILCALRPRPTSHCLNGPAAPRVLYSFLVVGSDSSPVLPASVQAWETTPRV